MSRNSVKSLCLAGIAVFGIAMSQMACDDPVSSTETRQAVATVQSLGQKGVDNVNEVNKLVTDACKRAGNCK